MLREIIIIISTFFVINVHTHAQSRYGRLLDDAMVYSTLSKSGILYLGIDNKIEINYSLLNSYDSLNLSSNNGIIIHDYNYILIPLRTGTLRLIINGYKSNKRYLIGHRNFIVEQVPNPQLKLNSVLLKDINIIKKIVMLNSDSLSVYISDDIPDSDKWYKVKEFSLGYNYGGHFISCNNIGNKFTDETLNFISKTEKNKEITMDVIIEGESNIAKNLPVIKFILTD